MAVKYDKILGTVREADATISDIAYDATTWDGNTDAPTKNAVRDKIESMSSGGLTQPQILTRTLGA